MVLAMVVGAMVVGSMTPAIASTPVADRDAAAARPDDLAALGRLRERQEDAWARGDGAAYAAIHTPDADVVTFNGEHLRTRAGIEAGMQHYFDVYLRGTRISTLTEQVRRPEPDLAVIVRTGCVLWPGEIACSEEALSINTSIAVKRHGTWWYTSFQNTRIRPLG
ncbi:SgcJ/EcaC family oxidoreductase [Micromonospora sp. NPDC049230]|uniref:SgcJ/EcaC family oxidoreductase n=1 Tax=Micromonospora sp. NPDC049230 TaxID=3155502 RepID=UPI0033E83F20